MNTYTAKDVAELLGCHKSTISRIATRREQAGEPIGSRHARTWLFTDDDVELLRPLVGTVGNPNFGTPEIQQSEKRLQNLRKAKAKVTEKPADKLAARKPRKKKA